MEKICYDGKRGLAERNEAPRANGPRSLFDKLLDEIRQKGTAMKRVQQLKRFAVGVLAAVMLLPTGVSAKGSYDDTAGHWAENTIEKWSVEYGILGGYGDGTFKPDNTITRGAFAGILCRFLGYMEEAPANTFSDTAGDFWEHDILKLNAAGVYLGTDGKALIYNSITRQQAVTMICRALDVQPSETALTYADGDQVAEYARGFLAALTEQGCITDVKEDNLFRPAEPITRAEVVNLLDNMIDYLLQNFESHYADVEGNLMVTAAEGVYIKGATISGDLIVAPGVTGAVQLENVTVKGRIRNLSKVEITVISMPEPEPEIPSYNHTLTEITYNGTKIPVKQDVAPNVLQAGDFRWENGRLVCTNPNFRTQFGIDVSAYQSRASAGGINWYAAAADGVEFAMVRIGLRGTSEGKLFADEYYAQNIVDAMNAGIETGVYFFSQAISVEEAIEEADYVISLLQGYTINGPVAFDWEMKDSSYRVYGIEPAVATACAEAFCQRIKDAGYQPMIYSSKYVGYMKLDLSALREYPIWYPEYKYETSSEAILYPSFYYQMSVWQYSDRLTVSGIGGRVDGNIRLIPVAS